MAESFVILVAVFVPMLFEGRRAAANERAQLLRGGIEPRDDVYAWMRFAYPGAFLLMIVEGLWRQPSLALFVSGAAVFVLAKTLKWWAIATLGPAWTFRVIVVPGDVLVSRGPYRAIRHPNYVAVIGELLGVALMTGAAIAGTVATAGFAVLLRRRIAVEERMLGL